MLHLRGHHIYCLRFSELQFPERGAHFQNLYSEIRSTLVNKPDTLMQVVAGPDDLCQACPHMTDNACQAPPGREPGVSKLDSIVLSGLGLDVGARLLVREYQAVIERKAPIGFCSKCRMDATCRLSALANNKGPL